MADIVHTVASAEGVDPVELTPPLADVVDPDALEAFVRDPGAGQRLQFEYRGWIVVVHQDGAVALDVPDGEA